MKKFSSALLLILIITSISLIHSCSKKTEEEDETCKTCKAFGVDGLAGEEEVCNDSEEKAFRAKYVGKEITCR